MGNQVPHYNPQLDRCLLTDRQECLFYLQQTAQSFLDSYLRFPAQLLAYTTQIRNIINRHGMRQGIIVDNGRFQLDQPADNTYYLQQRCRVFPSSPYIIQAVGQRRLYEGLTSAGEVIYMQDVTNRTTTQRQPNRPVALNRFNIVGDKAGFIAIRRPRINGRHSEDTGAEPSLPSIVFHVTLAQELRPFQSSLPAVVGWAGLRNGICIRICMRAID